VVLVTDDEVIRYLGGDPDADKVDQGPEAILERFEGLGGDTDVDSAGIQPSDSNTLP
jgi:hypothetical protein